MWFVVGLGCGDPDTDTGIEGETDVVVGASDPYAAWLASLGTCQPTTGDGRLDLVKACADEVCAGDAYAKFAAALGQPSCYHGWFGSSVCDWPAGIGAFFYDADNDLVIADASTATALRVFEGYTGTTADGLGISASFACYVGALGAPGELTIDPQPIVSGNSATWYEPYIWVQDGSPDEPPDSKVDTLFLAGG